MSHLDTDRRAVDAEAPPPATHASAQADGDPRGESERSANEYQQAIDRKPERYVMRLYIAGNSLRSRGAIENVRRVCDEYLCGRCDLEVIDIYQDLVRSQEDAVIAAPTLVKFEPLPRRRIIGDMSRTDKLLAGLGLVPHPA